MSTIEDRRTIKEWKREEREKRSWIVKVTVNFIRFTAKITEVAIGGVVGVIGLFFGIVLFVPIILIIGYIIIVIFRLLIAIF